MLNKIRKMIIQANKLDLKGLYKEASEIDERILKLSQKQIDYEFDLGVKFEDLSLEHIDSDNSGNTLPVEIPPVPIFKGEHKREQYWASLENFGEVTFSPEFWPIPNAKLVIAKKIEVKNLKKVMINNGILQLKANIIYAYKTSDGKTEYTMPIDAIGSLKVSENFIKQLNMAKNYAPKSSKTEEVKTPAKPYISKTMISKSHKFLNLVDEIKILLEAGDIDKANELKEEALNIYNEII